MEGESTLRELRLVSIRQVRFSPEDNLANPRPTGWTTVVADSSGVVRLGSNVAAETGDVVYAVAAINSDTAKETRLSLGSTSAAIAYLNGTEIAYLPNVKGLQRDECVVTAQLRRGCNVLALKLCRFWERHWMFYASDLSQ